MCCRDKATALPLMRRHAAYAEPRPLRSSAAHYTPLRGKYAAGRRHTIAGDKVGERRLPGM